MKKFAFLIALSILIHAASVFAGEPGQTLWTQTYGGSNTDWSWFVTQTNDGGFISTGSTMSFGAGGFDIYLLRTDSDGNELWYRTFGGSGSDLSYCVQETSDGGFIVAGYTASFGAGNLDFYVIKTDANGDSLWTRTYGSAGYDFAYGIEETEDCGYIIGGTTSSFGAGSYDFYLIKTDADGNEIWSNTYGGTGLDDVRSVRQTDDGGYIAVGYTMSFGNLFLVYVVKTDAEGTEVWSRTFGGPGQDMGYGVRQTADGGYAVIATTNSFGAGLFDVYLIRTDANGDSLWTRTYGDAGDDTGYGLEITAEGDFIITGATSSMGPALFNVYLLKVSSEGQEIWSTAHGGDGNDYAFSVDATDDGGYIVSGYTNSFGAGLDDAYLLRIMPDPLATINVASDDSVVVVPQGGQFGFSGTLWNYTADPLMLDAWTMAIGPMGNHYGPFKIFYDVPLDLYDGISAHLVQHVPGGAPAGLYKYVAYCGEYPSTVIDSSLFDVEVVEGAQAMWEKDRSWLLEGTFTSDK